MTKIKIGREADRHEQMTSVIEEEIMNKSELVSTIAQRTGQSEKDVSAVLNGFIDIVGETVAKGKDKVTIPGFLSFERVDRKARTGRNPQTGEPMKVPASKAVKVTAGARLKALAKNGK